MFPASMTCFRFLALKRLKELGGFPGASCTVGSEMKISAHPHIYVRKYIHLIETKSMSYVSTFFYVIRCVYIYICVCIISK